LQKIFFHTGRSPVPGSAGISPASSSFRLPTGRQDAGDPRAEAILNLIAFLEFPALQKVV
jgi:hypothetical protein